MLCLDEYFDDDGHGGEGVMGMRWVSDQVKIGSGHGSAFTLALEVASAAASNVAGCTQYRSSD